MSEDNAPLLFPDHRELEKAAINYLGIVGIALRRLDRNPSDVNSKWLLQQIEDVQEKQLGRHPGDRTEELHRLHLHLIYAVSYGRASE